MTDTLSFPTEGGRTVPPSYSSQAQNDHKPRKVIFGDDYEQRAPRSVNTVPLKNITLNWDFLSVSSADTIEGFVVAKRGVEKFLVETNRVTGSYFYVCETYERDPVGPDTDRISLTLRRVVA